VSATAEIRRFSGRRLWRTVYSLLGGPTKFDLCDGPPVCVCVCVYADCIADVVAAAAVVYLWVGGGVITNGNTS
jgi:hypothetical protein